MYALGVFQMTMYELIISQTCNKCNTGHTLCHLMLRLGDKQVCKAENKGVTLLMGYLIARPAAIWA